MAAKATAIDPVEESRERLADAERVHVERQRKLSDLREELEDLEDSHRAGDEDVTRERLNDARADVEHWSTLVAAAQHSIERARRMLVNDDPGLAEVLVPAVQSALPGVPVTVTTTRPSTAPQVPAVVLVQTKQAKADPITGSMSGAVDIVYFRTPLYREIDPVVIEREADRLQARLTAQARGSRETDGVVRDHVQIEVVSAWADVPVILRNPDDAFRLSNFATGVASDVRQAMQSNLAPDAGLRGVGSGSSGAAFTVHVATSPVAQVFDGPDENGRRRRIVRFEVKATPGRGCYHGLEAFRDHLHRAVAGQVGQCASALGRVERATVLNYAPATVGTNGRGIGGAVEAEFELVSQAPALVSRAPAQRKSEPTDVDHHGDRNGSHPGLLK